MGFGSPRLQGGWSLESNSTRASNENLDEKVLPFAQAICRYPKVAIYSIAVASASMVTGYSLSIIQTTTALPAFQHDFGIAFGHRYIIPSTWISMWSFIGPLGGMVGSLVGAHIQDRRGRRLVLAIGGVVAAIAVAILYCANIPVLVDSRRGIFLAGKLCQDFANGVIFVQALTYISEIAPTCLRGPAVALPGMFDALGHLVGATVMLARAEIRSSRAYSLPLATIWAFAVMPLLLSISVPESPAYLVRKGMMAEAMQAQRRLSRSAMDAQKAIERLAAGGIGAKDVPYMECFAAANRRRTFLVLYVNWMPALVGLALWSAALSYFMQLLGMSPHNSLIIMLLGVVLSLVAHMVGVWVVAAAGRRLLVLTSSSLTAVLYAAMGISGIWNGRITASFSAAMLLSIITVFALGGWPASNAIAAETSTLRLRSKTQGLGSVSSHLSSVLFGAVVPYLYGPDAGHLQSKVGFVFAALCLLNVGVVWLFVPELKGRSVTEIDSMFAKGLSARQFKGWNPSEDDK